MYNWAIDLGKLRKNRKQYTIWKLEQMVNFGLGEEKIKQRDLKKNWRKLHLDANKKKYLAWLLWPPKRS